MLREGQVAVDEFKEQAEGLVTQVEEAYKTVTGLWEWAKGLWEQLTGTTPAKQGVPETNFGNIEPQKPSSKQRAKEPDAELLQMQVVHKVSQSLGEFFDIQQKVVNHYASLEAESLSVYDPDQNKAKKAIERVEVELQMEYLGVQIREAMVYAPRELKDLYSRFLVMYGKIEEEQEFARQQQILAARYKKAREWRHRNLRIDLGMWALGMGVVWLVVVWTMMEVASLSGRLPAWFSLESFASYASHSP